MLHTRSKPCAGAMTTHTGIEEAIVSETVVTSSYTAGYLADRGHQCRLAIKPHKRDCDFIFKSSRSLEADLMALEQDDDLTEFIHAHRRIKFRVKEALREFRKGHNKEDADQ